MKWTIIILTIPGREKLLERLLDCLKPQIKDGVEINVVRDNLKMDVGERRRAAMEAAKGEYVNFVDDDDLVSKDYVEKILPLLDGVDYIGFPVYAYRDGVFVAAAYHSLNYSAWKMHRYHAERDISHLNPIRRELALQATMEGGFGEDARWADRLRRMKIVKTQHYVPEVMYHYYIRTHKPELEVAFAETK